MPTYQPIRPGAEPEATDPAGNDDADTTPVDDGTDTGAASLVPAVPAPPPPNGTDDQTTATTPARTRAATTDPDAAPEPTNRRARSVDADDRQPLDPRAERTGSIEGGQVRQDDDPFAPVGIPFGSFVLRPSIEQGLTATTNASGGPGGSSAILSETTLRLNATSDWVSNSATIDASGTFRESLSGESLDDARGRIDGTLN
ncbi:MAG: outer membrane beta-barrel protein, partial [Mesorhizobium sp.]